MLNKLSSPATVELADVPIGLQAAHGFDLREAISFVWRQWKFIASVVIIALLIGVVVVLKQTPQYTATSAMGFRFFLPLPSLRFG